MKGIKRKSYTYILHCPKQVEVLGLKCCWDLCSLIPHGRIHRMCKLLEKIIHARNVKMKWIVKVILPNTKRQYMWGIWVKSYFNFDKFIKCGKQLRWARNYSACEKSVMRRKKFIKHQVQYHLLNMKKVIFFKKDNEVKWSEYNICKECED